MFITLHRNGPRALFVRAGTTLEQVPPEALAWLGAIETSVDSELDAKTPMLGLNPSAILYDLTVHGYCVVDAQEIDGVTPQADGPPGIADSLRL